MMFLGHIILSKKEYKWRLDTAFDVGVILGGLLSNKMRGKKMGEQAEEKQTCQEAQERCGVCPECERLPEWQIRFQAEYREVKERYNKLHKIIVKIEAGTCDFKPNCSLDILKKQAKAMGEYLYTLEIRAEIENIPLK